MELLEHGTDKGERCGTVMNQQDVMRETPTVRLGQRLRRARLARNLTQGEVAKNQFSVSYVSAVERGQIRPSLGALERLAERLQVPVTDLLGDTDLEARFTSPSESREASIERYRDDVDSRVREAQVLGFQGETDDAISMLQRLANQQLSSRESAMVHWHLARVFAKAGRADEARREAAIALPFAERLNDRNLTERIRAQLAEAYAQMGNSALALDNYRNCLRAIDDGAIADPAFELSVLFNMGAQYAQTGDVERAIESLRKAADLTEAVANPERMGAVYWSLSQAYSSRGDPAQARGYGLRAIAAYEQAENRNLIGQTFNRLGRAYAQAGQVEDALTQLRAAHEMATAQQDARGIAEAQRSLALVYLQEQRVDEAAQAAQEAIERAEMVGDARQRADSLLVLAQVQEQRGEHAAAEHSFSESVDLLRAAEATDRLREAYAQYSEFLERRGESKRAYEMLKQAYRPSGRGAVTI